VDEIVTLSVQRERHVAALARDLEYVVEQLGSIPSVQKVILFGSYAAGRRDLLTDLDVLVVMDSPLDFVARNVELARFSILTRWDGGCTIIPRWVRPEPGR